MHAKTDPIPLGVCTSRDWDRSWRHFGGTSMWHEALGLVASTQLQEGFEQATSWTPSNHTPLKRCMAQHLERPAQMRAVTS